MMISTRGRYALHMMADLAENQGEGYVSLKDMSERQAISKKYMEQIIPLLNKNKLLMTTRGFQGGYRLAKEPKDYTLAEILCATEGNLAPVACLETEVNTCKKCASCETLFVWEGLAKVVYEYLNGITLQDIVDKKATIE